MGNQGCLSQTQNMMISLHLVCKKVGKICETSYLKNMKTIEMDCQIKSNCILIDSDQGIQLISGQGQKIEKTNILSMIDFKFEDNFITIAQEMFHTQYQQTPQTHIWKNITEKIQIQINSIFKIHSYQFKYLHLFQHQTQHPITHHQNTCKICYQDDQTPNNPLVAPCKCTGSLKYIHIQCLKEDLKISAEFTETDTGIRFREDKMVCSICKQKYEIYGKKRMNICEVLLNKNQKYLIMEMKQNDEEDETFIIIQKFKNNEIQIGRSSNNQIQLDFCKVSRKHMKISLNPETQSIYIQDCQSKFGSFIKIHKPIIFGIEDKKIDIRMGDCQISISKIIRIVQKHKDYKILNKPILSIFQQKDQKMARYMKSEKQEINQSYESTFEENLF